MVDLGTFGLPILVIALTVLCSLTTSQVDKEELDALSNALLLNLNLSDGVTSARRVVGFCRVSRPHRVTLSDQVENLVVVVYELLFEASDLDRVGFILAKFEFVMIIEKIVDFATVNFVHGYGDSEIPLVILPIIDTAFKKIFYCNALNAVHGVGLARASLTIGKDRYYTLIENQVKDRTHLVEVELFIALPFAEGIVKFELCVLDRLRHAIHFVLAVVDEDLGIHYRNDINLALSKLLMEYWTLLEANANLHLIGERVRLLSRQPIFFSLDHRLEINIDLDSL